MISRITLAAVLAGAAVLLAAGQSRTVSDTPAAPSPIVATVSPVPLPPLVAVIPAAVPAQTKPLAVVAPTTRAAIKPAGRVAPKATKAQVAQRQVPSVVQPQPAGTEPNGTGGWQLPVSIEPIPGGH